MGFKVAGVDSVTLGGEVFLGDPGEEWGAGRGRAGATLVQEVQPL